MSNHRRGRNPARAAAAALLGFLAAGFLIAALGEAELTPGVSDASPVDADSTRVLELQAEFDDGEDQTAVVLYATEGGELSSADVADLQQGFTDATGSRDPLQVSRTAPRRSASPRWRGPGRRPCRTASQRSAPTSSAISRTA